MDSSVYGRLSNKQNFTGLHRYGNVRVQPHPPRCNNRTPQNHAGVTMWTSSTQSVFLPLRNVRDMAHFELLVQQRTGGLRVTAYAPQGQRLDTMEAVRAVRHVIVIATARFVGGHTPGRRGRALSVEAMSRTAEVARADHRGAEPSRSGAGSSCGVRRYCGRRRCSRCLTSRRTSPPRSCPHRLPKTKIGEKRLTRPSCA